MKSSVYWSLVHKKTPECAEQNLMMSMLCLQHTWHNFELPIRPRPTAEFHTTSVDMFATESHVVPRDHNVLLESSTTDRPQLSFNTAFAAPECLPKDHRDFVES